MTKFGKRLMGLCFTLVAAICMLFGVGYMTDSHQAKAETTYYYDTATVYDMQELEGNNTKLAYKDADTGTMGKMPATENVAVQFYMTTRNVLEWNFKIGFLGEYKGAGSVHNGYNEYMIFFRYNDANTMKIYKQSTATYLAEVAFNWKASTKYLMEIGTYNVYDDEAKTNNVGRVVYVKIDNVLVAKGFDDAALAGRGAYVSLPQSGGQNKATNEGYVETTKATYNVTAETSGNGSVNAGIVLQGGNYVVKVTPDATAKVAAFTVNGEDKLASLVDSGEGYYTYTIENVQSDVAITATFAEKYYYDEATVYDMYDLTAGLTEATPSASYEQSLGQLPASENVAVQFKFKKGTSLQWNEKMGFLKTAGTAHDGNKGYNIYFHYQGAAKVGVEKANGAKAMVSYSIPNQEVLVEIGAKNVYSDEAKTEFAGRLVYVKINDTEVVTLLDEVATITEGDAGKYVTVPVFDGTFGNAGYIKTTRYYDEATVYDMYDLSLGLTEFTPSAEYKQTLGQLPASENVAVQFKFKKGTSLQWNEKMAFLKSAGNAYSETGAYYIFFHYQGNTKVGIQKIGGSMVEVAYTIPNQEVLVEIGTYNVYDNEAKQTAIARIVYVAIDGKVVAKHYDTNTSVPGTYVSGAVFDGTFGNVGYLKTTKDLSTKIVSASITLGEDLTMNYYVTMLDEFAAAEMIFTVDGKSETVSGTKVGDRYVFSLHLAPQYMASNIKAELVFEGETLASKDEYSIKTYAQNKLNAEDPSDELKQLVSDMLYYGAEAQLYKNYNTENLANEGVVGILAADIANVPTETDFSLTTAQNPVWFSAAGVYFDNVNQIYVKLQVADGTTLEDVTLKLNGVVVEELSTIVYTDGILATDFDAVYTFELYVGDSEEPIQVLKYSVNAYAYQMQNNEKMSALALAMYRYGMSAKAYNE